MQVANSSCQICLRESTSAFNDDDDNARVEGLLPPLRFVLISVRPDGLLDETSGKLEFGGPPGMELLRHTVDGCAEEM